MYSVMDYEGTVWYTGPYETCQVWLDRLSGDRPHLDFFIVLPDDEADAEHEELLRVAGLGRLTPEQEATVEEAVARLRKILAEG